MKKPAPSKIGLAVLTVEWTARGVLAPVMSLLLLEKGLSLGTLPVGMAIHSAVSLILEAPSGMLSDLFGRKRVSSLLKGFTSAPCSPSFSAAALWSSTESWPFTAQHGPWPAAAWTPWFWTPVCRNKEKPD